MTLTTLFLSSKPACRAVGTRNLTCQVARGGVRISQSVIASAKNGLKTLVGGSYDFHGGVINVYNGVYLLGLLQGRPERVSESVYSPHDMG
jgi:hypothetical protein